MFIPLYDILLVCAGKKYSQPFTSFYTIHFNHHHHLHSPHHPLSYNICSCLICVCVCVCGCASVFPLHSTFLLFSASFISYCYSLVKIRGLRHPFIIMFIFRWKKQNFHDDKVALYWRRSLPISYYLNQGRTRICIWWMTKQALHMYVSMYQSRINSLANKAIASGPANLKDHEQKK